VVIQGNLRGRGRVQENKTERRKASKKAVGEENQRPPPQWKTNTKRKIKDRYSGKKKKKATRGETSARKEYSLGGKLGVTKIRKEGG